MLQSLFDTLFGCSHQRTTFPITPARRSAVGTFSKTVPNGMYVTCLDCGKEFAYDWKAMRIGSAVIDPVPAAETQPSYR